MGGSWTLLGGSWTLLGGSWGLLEPPKEALGASKRVQEPPKRVQEPPKRVQDALKSLPRDPQEAPKTHFGPSWRPFGGFKASKIDSKSSYCKRCVSKKANMRKLQFYSIKPRFLKGWSDGKSSKVYEKSVKINMNLNTMILLPQKCIRHV